MPHINTRERIAFSLVEVLVALAVMAVLATIIIQVTTNVRNSADTAQCSSNLRHIHTATMLYTQDNHGRLPGPLYSAQKAWYRAPIYTNDGNLLNFIAPYLGLPEGTSKEQKAELFLCPAWVNAMGVVAAENSDSRIYGVEYTVRQMDGTYLRPFGYPRKTSSIEPALISSFDSPSQQVMLYDFDVKIVPSYAGRTNTAQDTVHNGKRNYLFFDGHIEFMEKHQYTY